jgi:hypothetical protein
MTCQEARDLFSARLDERLAPDEAARLDVHLAGCEECRREWARFDSVVSLVRESELPRAPAGFVDRVLEAARPVPWPLRLARRVFQPINVKLPLEAAALLLVGGLAVMIFQHSPDMQRVARQDAEPVIASKEEAPPASQPPSEVRSRRDAPLEDRTERDKKSEPISQIATSPPAPAEEPLVAAVPKPAAPAPLGAVASQGRTSQESQQRDATESGRRETAAKSAAAPSTVERLAARVRTPAPDVSARLNATDRAAALTALADLARRHGGSELARQTEPGPHSIDVAVPREAYDAFVRDVSRLGSFVAERQATDLPGTVRVSIRLE